MSRAGLLAVALLAVLAQPVQAPAQHEASPACRLPRGAPVPGSGRVLQVPSSYPTIQKAVDAAREGDTVLISPGVYRETVTVDTPGLRIRGARRTGVVLDGQSKRSHGFVVTADRVVLENMTAHNYAYHSFVWRNVHGFWGRYLTSYANGLDGFIVTESRCGQLDHLYATGSSIGFLIAECTPCDTVVERIRAEGNALGFATVQAVGSMTLRYSVFHRNRNGMTIGSEAEPLAEGRHPLRGMVVMRNLLSENRNLDTPRGQIPQLLYGRGICICGGLNVMFVGNTLVNHPVGVTIASSPIGVWVASGNVVQGNVVRHDPRRVPNAVDLAQDASAGPNNCWSGNTGYTTTAPPGLATIWDCRLSVTPPGGSPGAGTAEGLLADPAAFVASPPPNPPPGDWKHRRPASCSAKLGPTGPCVELIDDNRNGRFADDGAVDRWLPALGHDG